MATKQDDAPPVVTDDSGLPGAYVMRPAEAQILYDQGVDPVEEGQTDPSLDTASAPPDTQQEPETDLSYLALPEDFGIAEAPLPQLPAVAPIVDSPEAREAAQKLGFTLEEINAYLANSQTAIQKVAKYENEIRQQRQLNTLQKEWGVSGAEFQQRMKAVTERFLKYDKATQQRLDTVEGAKLIYAYLQQQKQQAKPEVPNFQRSSSSTQPTGAAPKYRYTEAQITAMSNEDYKKNSAKILDAYAKGLVKK